MRFASIEDWREAIKAFPGALLPSPPDERDWVLSALPLASEVPFDNASLRRYSGGVLDQLQAPICASATGCAAMEMRYGIRFSMRWLYGQAKKIDGTEPGTSGTTFRAILQVLSKKGCCPEELCPTFPDWDNWDFTEKMDQEASKYKIASYARLNVGEIDDIEKAIANGLPVFVGTLVTRGNWMDGDEYIIEPLGSFLGGHATLGMEYDRLMEFKKYKNFVTLQNSWGDYNGRNGFYYMAEHYAKYELIDLPGFKPLMEAWAVSFDQNLTPDIKDTPDDASKWAREARDWARAEGITDGTRPKEDVTREEIWTMLYRLK